MKTLAIVFTLVFLTGSAGLSLAYDEHRRDYQSQSIWENEQRKRELEVQKDIQRQLEKQSFEMQQERQDRQQDLYEQRSREYDRQMRDRSIIEFPWND